MDPRPLVLAVDPGLVSGLAVIEREGPRLRYSAELKWWDLQDTVNAFLHEAGPQQVNVVAERFIITKKTAENSQAPWSLEVIGMLKTWSRMYQQGAVELYGAGDCKEMFPNDVLRRLGMWHKGGEGHARDAIRVGLMCLINTRWVDSRLLEQS